MKKLSNEEKYKRNLGFINPIPIKGQKIYVPTSIYVYRGEDDFMGGIATISDIEYDKILPKDHYNHIMISIEENPKTGYNWNYIYENQKKWKKEYKGQIAHPDPDLRPEFNDDNADWR